MNKGILAAGAMALAVGSIAAGCGGGDDSTTTSAGATGATGAQGPALSKGEFISQGDQICTNYQQTLKQAASSLGSSPSSDDVQQFAEKTAIPAAQTEIDHLRQLTPPANDQDAVSAIFDAAQKGLDELKSDPSLLTKPNGGGTFDEANQLATQYGFKVCGSG